MKSLIYIILGIFLMQISCSEGQFTNIGTSKDRSKDSGSNEEPADETASQPEDVTGMYLTLGPAEGDHSEGTDLFGSAIKVDGKKAEKVEYKSITVISDSAECAGNVVLAVAPSESIWHVTFEIKSECVQKVKNLDVDAVYNKEEVKHTLPLANVSGTAMESTSYISAAPSDSLDTRNLSLSLIAQSNSIKIDFNLPSNTDNISSIAVDREWVNTEECQSNTASDSSAAVFGPKPIKKLDPSNFGESVEDAEGEVWLSRGCTFKYVVTFYNQRLLNAFSLSAIFKPCKGSSYMATSGSKTCWYLGGLNESCEEFCKDHLGYDLNTDDPSIVTADSCQFVLENYLKPSGDGEVEDFFTRTNAEADTIDYLGCYWRIESNGNFHPRIFGYKINDVFKVKSDQSAKRNDVRRLCGCNW